MIWLLAPISRLLFIDKEAIIMSMRVNFANCRKIDHIEQGKHGSKLKVISNLG